MTKKRNIKLGPVDIGIGSDEEKTEKKHDTIELQSKLNYTIRRLEKKAEASDDKYERKRINAKKAVREGKEKVAKMRLKSAKLQSAIAERARNSAMGIEAVRDRIEQVRDYRELQEVINELGDSLGDLMPEQMMGSVKESMAELEKVMSSATVVGEKMSEELATITTGEVTDEEVEREMEKLAEEVQAETEEELRPAEIRERAEVARDSKHKETR